MNGLLVKDFIILKRNMKSLAAMMVIFIVTGWLDESSGMVMALAFVLSMSVMSSFSYDQFSNWETYALVAPISKRQYVASKYVLGAFLSLIGALLVLVVLTLKMQLRGTFDGELLLVMGAVALLGSFMLSSATLPLLFNYPIEKARYAVTALVAAAILAGSGAGYLVNRLDVTLVARLATISISQLLVLLLGLTLFVLVVSFPLALHLFNRKFT